jgi:tubby-related protein 1
MSGTFGFGEQEDNGSSLSAMTKTEADLAQMNIMAEFDPKADERAAERMNVDGPSASRSSGRGGSAAAATAPQAPLNIGDIREFLNQVPSPGTTRQCYIVRKKAGFAKMFPSYKLYLQEANVPGPAHMNNRFLLAARKRKKQKKSNYLLSLDEEDLGSKGANFFGKLKSNFTGTEFNLYDKGSKPGAAVKADASGTDGRKELGIVLYETNVLGTKGPRKMTVVVPPVTANGTVKSAGSEGMLEAVKAGSFGECIRLHNKAPRWNESLGAYCLNFNGRVTLPSVKNFQLQIADAPDPDQVSLQFGKTGDHTFTMDYSYPLSPVQAFEIVLSSFDHKWACE